MGSGTVHPEQGVSDELKRWETSSGVRQKPYTWQVGLRKVQDRRRLHVVLLQKSGRMTLVASTGTR